MSPEKTLNYLGQLFSYKQAVQSKCTISSCRTNYVIPKQLIWHKDELCDLRAGKSVYSHTDCVQWIMLCDLTVDCVIKETLFDANVNCDTGILYNPKVNYTNLV